MMKKVLVIVGHVVFGLLVFLVATYITLPLGLLKERIAREIEVRSNFALTIDLGAFDTHWLTGVRAEGATLTFGQPSETNPAMVVDELEARVSLLGLLLGRLDLSVKAVKDDAQIELEVAEIGPAIQATWAVEGLSLLRLPMLGAMLGLPVAGVLTTRGQVSAAGFDLSTGIGDLLLEIKGLSLGPGEVMGTTLPRMGLGDLELEAGLGEGRLLVKRFKAKGDALEELDLSGAIRMNKSLARSKLELELRAKPGAAFLRENPKLDMFLQFAGKYKDAQGAYKLPIKGTLQSPAVR